MVQRLAENIAAQVLPVALSIDHVQMPGLIHFVARRHRMPGTRCEVNEPTVFLDHPPREGEAPSVFPCQPLTEGES